MSIIALAFLASAPAAPVTGEAAMAAYLNMTTTSAPSAAAQRARCAANASGDEIVVCGSNQDQFRLPMRDARERAAGGDVIRHPDEAPRSSGAVDIAPCHPSCPDEPHAPETIHHILSWLKGEDPD